MKTALLVALKIAGRITKSEFYNLQTPDWTCRRIIAWLLAGKK